MRKRKNKHEFQEKYTEKDCHVTLSQRKKNSMRHDDWPGGAANYTTPAIIPTNWRFTFAPLSDNFQKIAKKNKSKSFIGGQASGGVQVGRMGYDPA